MGLAGAGDTSSASTDGSSGDGRDGRDGDAQAGGAPSGGPGDGVQGGAGVAAGGRPPPVSCASVRDASWFADGRELYVDDDAGCEGATPCFTSLGDAVGAARHGDTIVVLPGTHGGALVRQADELGALRIVSRDGPRLTTIAGTCIEIRGEGHDPGEIWVEGFTFGNCGPSTSTVSDGWGVAVSTWAAVDVRIEGNAFGAHGGAGGIGILSSTVGVHVGAVIARNTFVEQTGAAALQVDLPSHREPEYCIRIENNLMVHNDTAVDFFYTPFDEPRAQFELVNNTIADNQIGLRLSGPTGRHLLANNVFFGNERDLPPSAELVDLVVQDNVIASGQFSGLDGNFAADPRFETGYRLGAGSPALGRGDPMRAPLLDLEGNERGAASDLGAYQGPAEPADARDPLCGDGVVSFGAVDTRTGPVVAFEGCDDGNLRDGDGCSSRCLFEPSASTGLISRVSSSLCAVRSDGSLSCWGSNVEGAPVGVFQQVAVSAYHGCALTPDGEAVCWARGRATFAPGETFVQIASDYDQACGVRDDGGVTCWDESETTLTTAGSFVRVDTNQRVCAIDARGTATCWGPDINDTIELDGVLLQTFPTRGGGCELTVEGRLVCDGKNGSFLDVAPAAGLARVAIDKSDAAALRPDGRPIVWRHGSLSTPVPDRTFIDVVSGFGGDGCGLTADHRVHCWDFAGGDLPRE